MGLESKGINFQILIHFLILNRYTSCPIGQIVFFNTRIAFLSNHLPSGLRSWINISKFAISNFIFTWVAAKIRITFRSPKSLIEIFDHLQKFFYMTFHKPLITLFLILAFGSPFSQLKAQKSIGDSAISLTLAQVTYRGMVPGGDLPSRFGFISEMGVDLVYKFKSNFYLASGFHGLFADNVKEERLLENIMISGGYLITDNGLISTTRIIGSGFVVPLSVGKSFPIIKGHNKNSGLFIELGGRFMQHKIRITAPEDEVSPISGDYAKGYDRLTNGLGIREAIGYRFLGNKGFVNFTIGVELSQNFTQNRRSITFDNGVIPAGNRKDFLSGFFFSWIFPFYERAPDKVYFK